MTISQSVQYGSNIPVLNTIQALRTYNDYQDQMTVIVLGNLSFSDGNGGIYTFDSTDTSVDDGINTIQPTSIASGTPGRFILTNLNSSADGLISSLKAQFAASSGASLIGYGDSTVASTLDSLSTSIEYLDIKNVMEYGVVDDPNGSSIDANMTAYLNAFKETAGKYRLYHPKELSIVMKPFATGALDGVYWNFDGTWKLVDSGLSNIFDITGWTNFVIEGTGTFDGNKSGQSSATYPNALAGISSNVSGTQNTTTGTNSVGGTITIPPMPIVSSSPIITANGLIRGIEITNCFNWPINLAYIQNVKVEYCTLHDSNSSPQFFQSAIDCQFNYNQCYNITDGGFVFYRGNIRCSATGNNVHDCNDGIGVYAEYDMLPADSFININNNFVWNNKDGGIGVTTGLTPPALMQQRILISNNILYSNNTGGRDGGGSIGIVGAQGVMIKDNMIFGDGNGLTVTTPSYGIFIDGQSTFIDIDGNQIADIGCSTGKGFGIFLSNPNNVSVQNNTGYCTQGSNGVMEALIAGGFGAACVMSNNKALGLLAGAFDQVNKPSDLTLEQRSGADNTYLISNGLTLTSGNFVIDSGTIALSSFYDLAAAGSTQTDAATFTQQTVIVTSGSTDAGIILPDEPYGIEYTIHNRSGSDIKIYPPSNGQIEGLGVNVGAVLKNTFSAIMVGIASKTTTGGQWYGANYPSIGNYTWS